MLTRQDCRFFVWHERTNSGSSSITYRRSSVFIIFCCLALFPLLGIPVSWAASGEPQNPGEILAIGEAAVVKGNSALAKKAAVHQALMKGVEDYVVHLLGSQGTVSHFDRVTETIIPAARDEIDNFHLLAEREVDGRYKVLLRLRVNEEIIRERLRSGGLLKTEIPSLNVLFLVSENRDGEVTYWWKDAEGFRSLSPVELVLHKVFQDRGFSPINRTLSPPGADQVQGLTSPDLQDEDIVKWGRLFSADVVIHGQCRISGGKEVSLALQAVNLSQGDQGCREFISEQMKEASGDTASFVNALEGMVNRLAATLCPCITGGVARDRGGPSPLTVTLAGMTMPKQFWRFSGFLSHDVVGVTSVIPSRIKGNTMSATVEFRGDRHMFINRVLSHSKRPFPLRINQTQDGMIVFDLE